MTVANDKFFSDWYAANGVNKNWGFDFIIQLSTDAYIEVRNDTTGDRVVSESGFSVTWTSPDLSTGFVTFPSSGAAVANGYSVRVVRDVPYTQGTQIGKEGSFDPMIHERAFDRLTMMAQQLKNGLDRSIKVPIGSNGFDIGVIADNKVLMKFGTSIVEGPSADAVAGAQQNAVDAIAARNLAEQYRDEAEAFAEAIDPANYYTKTEIDTQQGDQNLAISDRALKTTTISGGGLVTGGGDLSASRTITVPKSTNAQAIAGTDDTTAMTPLRTKEAIAANSPALFSAGYNVVSLSLGAAKQNVTAKPIFVSAVGVSAIASQSTTSISVGPNPGALALVSYNENVAAAAGRYSSATAIVPPGQYYSVGGSNSNVTIRELT